jgi:hypothetical protein
MPYERKVDWDAELDNIKKLGSDGKTMQEIADLYGVSRQRIKQIQLSHIPDWQENYGKFIRDQKRDQLVAEANKAYLKKWGPQRGVIPKDLYTSQRAKFSRKRTNALRIGYSWEIEFTDLDWVTHCPILGMELDYFASYAQENSPSFDRIDTTQGYVKGNVQLVSWRANRIKNDGTAEEHQLIADYLRNLHP